MEDSTRKNLIFLVTALLAVVAGVAVGVSLFVIYPRLQTRPAATVQTCKLDAETMAALAAVKDDAAMTREEVDTLRVVMADLVDRLESRPSGGGAADSLPPPYVRQVTTFFNTATARTLLSNKVSAAANVRFGEPSFVDSDLIAVPYTFSGKTNYLLVKIKILDYYDLQFDVIWDSLEGSK